MSKVRSFVGNTWDWSPPRTFDYVSTTLDYVPDELWEAFIHRLLERFVQPGGRLLINEYLGRNTGVPEISNTAPYLTQPLIPYTILPSFETAHSAVRAS